MVQCGNQVSVVSPFDASQYVIDSCQLVAIDFSGSSPQERQNPSEVNPGETVQVTTQITNNNNVNGTATVRYTVNGSVVAENNAAANAGQTVENVASFVPQDQGISAGESIEVVAELVNVQAQPG